MLSAPSLSTFACVAFVLLFLVSLLFYRNIIVIVRERKSRLVDNKDTALVALF